MLFMYSLEKPHFLLIKSNDHFHILYFSVYLLSQSSIFIYCIYCFPILLKCNFDKDMDFDIFWNRGPFLVQGECSKYMCSKSESANETSSWISDGYFILFSRPYGSCKITYFLVWLLGSLRSNTCYTSSKHRAPIECIWGFILSLLLFSLCFDSHKYLIRLSILLFFEC